MVASPSQHRSRSTRDALLQAAINLLAEGGARAITHRAVAARAGVSATSTTYYFGSIQELTDEALARHVADRSAELEELVAVAVDAGGSAAEVSERVAESLADRADDVVVAQFEVYLEAWRNPGLKEPVGRAIAAFEALATDALRALGVAQPAEAAPAFVALVDGFALHRLARPRPRDEEHSALRSGLRALFMAAVMDRAEAERWRERLARPTIPPSGATPT